ncbi:hypothetical protein EV121DRAFT_296620 [Schizophyllum commune]
MSSSPLHMPSSPAPVPDDVDMGDGTVEETFPDAPNAESLFLPGTPSAAGTPSRSRASRAPDTSPSRNVVARRAMGMNTPQRTPQTPLFEGGSSPRLTYPSSSARSGARNGAGSAPRSGYSDGLAFPGSPTKTPVNRRGDIHSSLSLTPSFRRHHRQTEARPARSNLQSDASGLDVPMSSNANLSALPAAQSDEPDEIRAIWGTTVNLAETMKSFREFLHGFKPKYRTAYDREGGLILTKVQEGEQLLYETYLRRMRITDQANLNLDINNLAAYPPCKKLHSQVVKYPQEVIPAWC